MKLIKKYRSFTYTSLTMVVIIAFVTNYYLFRYSIHRTTDDVLNEYRIDVEDYAAEYDTLDPLLNLDTKLTVIDIYESAGIQEEVDETIVDTLLYSHYEKEMVVYRKLLFPVQTSDKNYVVRIMLPTLEEHDLVEAVIISLLLVVVLFIIFSSMIDWTFSRQIFNPFNRILATMKSYHLEQKNAIHFEQSDIDEFSELNRILSVMITKINRGYEDMKKFLEYTSHELQTPLSIIQLKVEALNQTDFEDEQTRENIHSIQVALNRIIRFNRSLLFIAKIRSNQFAECEAINLTALVRQHISQYDELLSMREIQVDALDMEDFVVYMNPVLAEYLVQNPLINAIRHNREKGIIRIWCAHERLQISNTFEGEIPAGNLFDTYTRTSNCQESSGLGLSIVKNICQNYNYDVSYRFDEKVFTLIIKF